MKIHIIAAALPPELDGIGDYTAYLATELARSTAVTVLTGTMSPDSIPGVRIENVFSPDVPRSVCNLAAQIERDQPDWVLLQYNPFSYGRWGLNLHLPLVMKQIRHRCPGVRIAVMAHETFVPFGETWQFRLMTIWQRSQFAMLSRTADVLFFSMEAWAQTFKQKFPGKPVIHLPVGSNIPCLPFSKRETRTALEIPEETVVLGLFGTMHVSRMLERVRDAFQITEQTGKKALVLYVGPHSQAVRNSLGDIPIVTDGPLSGSEISRRFAAMDIYLTPFIDGVSTRRGTVMSGLQHGVALVGTSGYNTDSILKAENGNSFLLAEAQSPRQFNEHIENLLDQPELCKALAHNGQKFFNQNFTWSHITSQLLATLEAAS